MTLLKLVSFLLLNWLKVLGNGSLTTKLDVEAHAFSKSAVAAIQAVGGNCQLNSEFNERIY